MYQDMVKRDMSAAANATAPSISRAELAALHRDLRSQNGWLAALSVLNGLTCKNEFLLGLVVFFFVQEAGIGSNLGCSVAALILECLLVVAIIGRVLKRRSSTINFRADDYLMIIAGVS